jgi:hypothetical protein
VGKPHQPINPAGVRQVTKHQAQFQVAPRARSAPVRC